MTTTATGTQRDRLDEWVTAAVVRRRDDLVALSHAINAAAEPGFAEHRSAGLVADLLRGQGHRVQVGGHGLPTALRAAAGTGRPRVAILAEYDALPGIGHGCGHNVIAATAVAAFLAVADGIERTGGAVELVGCPAEENGAGKEILARAGAFDDVDAAVMVHPWPGADLPSVAALGSRVAQVRYTGRAAHASAAPQDGRNALDAMVAAYQGIAALRQHVPPSDRLHAIITEGGTAVNVVPETAAGTVMLRSATIDGLIELTARVGDVLRAAALMTGTTVQVTWDARPAYLPMRSNRALADRYVRHARRSGRRFADRPAGAPPPGSTDMGNISLRVPSIHPMAGLGPIECALHTAGFAQAAVGPGADAVVVDCGTALAATVVDFLTDPALRDRVRTEFEAAGGAVDVPALLARVHDRVG